MLSLAVSNHFNPRTPEDFTAHLLFSLHRQVPRTLVYKHWLSSTRVLEPCLCLLFSLVASLPRGALRGQMRVWVRGRGRPAAAHSTASASTSRCLGASCCVTRPAVLHILSLRATNFLHCPHPCAANQSLAIRCCYHLAADHLFSSERFIAVPAAGSNILVQTHKRPHLCPDDHANLTALTISIVTMSPRAICCHCCCH